MSAGGRRKPRRDSTVLGRVLKRRRWMCGLSVRAAGDEMGIGPATVSRVERGYLPNVPTMLRICLWADVDANWMFRKLRRALAAKGKSPARRARGRAGR